jgi:hypothetical protein
MWEPRRLTTLWASTTRYRESFTLYIDSFTVVSRDSVVGIATGYVLNEKGVGVRVPVGLRIFTTPYRPDRL